MYASGLSRGPACERPRITQSAGLRLAYDRPPLVLYPFSSYDENEWRTRNKK